MKKEVVIALIGGICTVLAAVLGSVIGKQSTEQEINNIIKNDINIDNEDYLVNLEKIIDENAKLKDEIKALKTKESDIDDEKFEQNKKVVLDAELFSMVYSDYSNDWATFRVSNEFDQDGRERKNALCYDFEMNGGYGGKLEVSYRLDREYSLFLGTIISKSIYVDSFGTVHSINMKVYADERLLYDISVGDSTEDQDFNLDVKCCPIITIIRIYHTE